MPYKRRSTAAQKPSHLAPLKKPMIWAPVVAIVLLAGLATAWYIHSGGLFKSTDKTSGQTSDRTTLPNNKSQSPSPAPPPTPTPSSSDTGTKTDTSTNPVPAVDPNTPLKQPSGEFVSSHAAYVPRDAARTSTCRTTPGASCTISFTLGSVTKSLKTKVANADGVAAWEDSDSWTADSVGLTPGSWTVTAKATLGTQVLETTDQTKLEIQ